MEISLLKKLRIGTSTSRAIGIVELLNCWEVMTEKEAKRTKLEEDRTAAVLELAQVWLKYDKVLFL